MSDGGRRAKSSSSFHFLAGLSSGITTAFLLQPADLLKTRVQQSHTSSLRLALRDILNGPNPVQSLWRGTVPSVIRTGAGSALYFGCLNQLRTRMAEAAPGVTAAAAAAAGTSNTSSSEAERREGGAKAKTKASNTTNLLSGALARASAGFIMSPVTVLKVRYESSYYKYTSLFSAARDVLARDGARGFFAGFGATAVRDAPYAGLYVLFYEQAKEVLGTAAAAKSTSTVETGGGVLAAPSINFASGVVAAVSATALTNPFDAIKTRLQLMPARYGNMVRAAKMMVRDEGAASLFDGLALRMTRKAISSALAWTVYEELIRRAEARISE